MKDVKNEMIENQAYTIDSAAKFLVNLRDVVDVLTDSDPEAPLSAIKGIVEGGSLVGVSLQQIANAMFERDATF